ncbi:hypothetical protein [Mycobacterium talmoniae]|uniref:Uncharacterized protein n=1 Tax=Mycobacterium talmoniae TaxID=1858794 RepID=A0A1S1NF66_9MYCO|nr:MULTISPECIES: hypothetical protein [Mycobacterium]OHV04307.1 hypothetical protein BKN37_10690 [Mycobacterium talmoniae]PQM48957.1 hypothetical protein C1Y40_00823 [Mycobacterium talmoniae]TDH57479.1 hypothetical protein E2F47_01510 [Mycobacterium eburneum]
MDPSQPEPGDGTPPRYESPPSRGTALTAGTLSLLGGIANGLAAISNIMLVGSPELESAGLSTGYFGFVGLAAFVIAIALLVGGIMLLRRRSAGRLIIVTGCVGAVLLNLVNFAYSQDLSQKYGPEIAIGVPRLVVGISVASVTAMLALAASTERWCRAGHANRAVS